MSHIAPLLPDNAPFTASQRAWLNGWLAGQLAMAVVPATAAEVLPVATTAPGAEDFPWHDPALALEERLRLAADKRGERQLRAAMAQLDCGQCGYLCRSYAEAIAAGTEPSLTRCVPGGKETARALKELLDARAVPAAAVPASVKVPAAAPPAASARALVSARLEGAHPLNGQGSAKDTRHVVFHLDEAPLDYAVGDSLGVQATNCPELVAAIIERLGGRPGDAVDCPDGSRRTLAEALTIVCDIGRPSDAAVEVLASRAPDH